MPTAKQLFWDIGGSLYLNGMASFLRTTAHGNSLGPQVWFTGGGGVMVRQDMNSPFPPGGGLFVFVYGGGGWPNPAKGPN